MTVLVRTYLLFLFYGLEAFGVSLSYRDKRLDRPYKDIKKRLTPLSRQRASRQSRVMFECSSLNALALSLIAVSHSCFEHPLTRRYFKAHQYRWNRGIAKLLVGSGRETKLRVPVVPRMVIDEANDAPRTEQQTDSPRVVYGSSADSSLGLDAVEGELDYYLTHQHTPSRRQMIASTTMVALLTQHPVIASAKSGEFANFGQFGESSSQLGVGDSNNECLWYVPGSSVCQIYESSDPKLWDSANLAPVKEKLFNSAANLNDLDTLIAKSRWNEIISRLGASRDLREAANLLTKEQPGGAKLAKKVFQDLNGLQSAAQKKDQKLCSSFFAEYRTDFSRLVAKFEGRQ